MSAKRKETGETAGGELTLDSGAVFTIAAVGAAGFAVAAGAVVAIRALPLDGATGLMTALIGSTAAAAGVFSAASLVVITGPAAFAPVSNFARRAERRLRRSHSSGNEP